ncbi:hypothetical protein ACFLU6_00625 [Acidobacteriota bacterium]
MGGVVGLISAQPHQNSLGSSLSSLCHHDCFVPKHYINEVNLLLGAAIRSNSPFDNFIDLKLGVSVIVYGMPIIRERNWRLAEARFIRERYLEQGIKSIYGLDGSFVIVIVDKRKGRLSIINDRIGSLPVLYAANEGQFAFSPEAKAIFPLLNLKPCLDMNGIIAFLNSGYPIGNVTLFESIRLLEPAHLVEIDLFSAEFTLKRYWDLKFNGSANYSLRDAAEDLHETIVDALKAVFLDDPGSVQLLLTGGYDSRAILGSLTTMQRPPDEALTWGISDSIPNSDPDVARRLARMCDVPFRHLQYTADTFVDHASRWTYISELMSDNAGNFAAGADFQYRESNPASVLLIGDQMLGPGGFYRNVNDAIENITKVPTGKLVPALTDFLQYDYRDQFAQSYWQQIERILRTCPNDDPKDIQDYFFFYLYVFRWLLAPAYFKEPMVSPRRPLLLGSVIDFTCGLPGWLRVDKRVLLKMMQMKMPHLMRIQRDSANSLVDWSFELRQNEAFRRFVLNLLSLERIESTPLKAFIDRNCFEAFIKRFFSAKPSPISRQPSIRTKIFALRRHFSLTPTLGQAARLIEPLVGRMLRTIPGSQSVKVILRLAMISLLQQLIDEGRFEADRKRNDVSFQMSAMD